MRPGLVTIAALLGASCDPVVFRLDAPVAPAPEAPAFTLPRARRAPRQAAPRET